MRLSKSKIGILLITIIVCIVTIAYIWGYNGIHYENKDVINQTVSEYQMFIMNEQDSLTLPFAPEKNYIQSISVLMINLEPEETGDMFLTIANDEGTPIFDTSVSLSSISAGEFFEIPVNVRVSTRECYSILISQKGATKTVPYLLYADSTQIENGADPLVAAQYCNEASNWEKVGILLSVLIGLVIVIIFLFDIDILRYLSSLGTKLFLGLLLIVQFIMMMPSFRYNLESVSLDPSWRYVLNILGHKGYKFGDDVFFTYGPLGFICYLMNLDNNGITYYLGLLILVVVVIINAILLIKVFKLAVENKIPVISVILASVVYIVNYSKPEWDNYMLYTLILGVIVAFKERKEAQDKINWKHIVTIASVNYLFVIMSLSKFSTFTSALAFTILFAVFDYFFNHRLEGVSYFAPACVVSVIAYLIYNPSVSSLFRYLGGIFKISDGWMVSSQADFCFTPSEFRSLIFMMIIFVILIVIAIVCDYKSSHIIISMSASMFLLFKYASTRHGLTCGLWLYAMLFSAAVLSFDWSMINVKDRLVNRKLCICGIVAIIGISCTSILETSNLHYSAGQVKSQLVAKVDDIVNINEFSVLQETIDSSQLPQEILDKIGDDSVCIYNYKQALAATNPSLNLYVYPSVQGELTKIPLMEQRNTYFFNSPDAPTYILFTFEAIDERIELFDSPYTWDGIKSNYQVDSVYDNITLLKKVSTGTPKDDLSDQYALLSEESYAKDMVIEVPNGAKYAKVKIDFNLVGKLKKFLYHVYITNININYSDGRVLSGRAIIPTLGEGFEISYFPQNVDEMIQILGYVDQPGSEESPNMTSISFSGRGLEDIADNIVVEWYG